MATFEDYLQSMATYARGQTPELTDLRAGSVYRSILEAIAMQLELIEAGAADLADGAIREAAYQLWTFDRRPAAAASGTLRFTATATIGSDITIPAGTQARAPGTDKVYRTLAQATFPAGAAGSTLNVLVASIGAGASFNTAAATITELVIPIAGLSVSNPAALTNGADAESDDERQQRFATFVRSIHRGTADSIAYAAEQTAIVDGATGLVTERVTGAKVIDTAQGLATCYVINGTTSAASSPLLAAVASNIASYKAAGVTINVAASALTSQTVTCAVRLLSTVTLAMVITSVRQALTDLFAALTIGETLYLEQIRHAIMQVPGVIDCTVATPSGDVAPAASGRVVLSGTPTVTQL